MAGGIAAQAKVETYGKRRAGVCAVAVSARATPLNANKVENLFLNWNQSCSAARCMTGIYRYFGTSLVMNVGKEMSCQQVDRTEQYADLLQAARRNCPRNKCVL